MEEGKLQPFYGYTVQGDGVDKKGRKVKNPRIFGYPKKRPTMKGMSIRVKKVEGFGETSYLEVSCYGDAFEDAKKLKLQHGDKIDFFGRYNIEKGKKHDFPKVSVNDSMQIRIFSGRAAKANEI